MSTAPTRSASPAASGPTASPTGGRFSKREPPPLSPAAAALCRRAALLRPLIRDEQELRDDEVRGRALTRIHAVLRRNKCGCWRRAHDPETEPETRQRGVGARQGRIGRGLAALSRAC